MGNEISEGIHFDLSRERYDAIEAEHFSTLKHMRRSAQHYLYAKNAGFKDTASKKRGRAGHVATLEPERFAAEHVVYPGERRGNKWKEFEEAHAGREILTEAEAERAKAIAAAVRANPLAAKYLTGGRAEVSMLWTCEGQLCKGRIDYLSDLALVDLKITKDASPEGFGWECREYQSHVQSAFYGDGFAWLARESRPFVLIAVEPEPPHLSAVYRVTPAQLALGAQVYREWLAQVAWCRTTKEWGGYAGVEMDLQLPMRAWTENGLEEAA